MGSHRINPPYQQNVNGQMQNREGALEIGHSE